MRSPAVSFMVRISPQGEILEQHIVRSVVRIAERLTYGDVDEDIRRQNIKIYDLRNSVPRVDEYINKLESNIRLTDEESQYLIAEMERILWDKDG